MTGSNSLYPDITSAAKDWLELAEYHGSSDARNGQIVFLLPQARAFFVDARSMNGTLNLTIGGSDVGRNKLLVKGAYWVGRHIRHFETEVRGTQLKLEVPNEIDRIEYVLTDSEGQIYDLKREAPDGHPKHLGSGTTAIDASVPSDFIAGPEETGGFRALYPSSEFNASTFNTAPFNSPSSSRRSNEVTAGGSAAPGVWGEQSEQILTRLQEIEEALQSVSTVLAQIREANAAGSHSQSTHGIGHNHPPSEDSLASTTIEQAVSAKELLKEEAAREHPSSNALNLSSLALQNAARFADWLLNQGRTFIEESVKSAGKKFGGHTINLTALYGSLEILRSQLPLVTDAINAFLRTIGFFG